MEAIVGLIVVYWAMTAALRGAQDAVKHVYGQRVASRKAKFGKSPTAPASTGVKAGAAAATALTGVWHAGRGFVAGWPIGWRKGKARGREWWERRHPVVPSGGTETVPVAAQTTGPLPHVPVVAVSTPAGTGTTTTGRDDATRIDQPGDPVTEGPAAETLQAFNRTHDDPGTATADPATTPEGTGPVTTIATTTGGEVHTMQQLIDELNQVAKQAIAEQEDGEAAQKRTTEVVGWLDNLQASLEENDLDQQTLADVTNLADLCTQLQKLRGDTVSALDSVAAVAGAAATGVHARHGAMQEAIYATPHKAKDEFYAA